MNGFAIIGPALILASAMAFAPVAGAQVRSEAQCLEAHPEIRSPVEMATCTSDLEGSRRRLEQAHVRLIRRISWQYLAALHEAQSAWETYRDAHCRLDAGAPGGGTMQSAAVVGCEAEMNRARAAELDREAERWDR